jgi:hypothetical protein
MRFSGLSFPAGTVAAVFFLAIVLAVIPVGLVLLFVFGEPLEEPDEVESSGECDAVTGTAGVLGGMGLGSGGLGKGCSVSECPM